MSKIYLLIPTINDKRASTVLKNRSSTLEMLFSPWPFEIGDRLLRVYSRNGTYEGIQPSVETIIDVNGEMNLLTFETEKAYPKMVPIDVVKNLLNRPLSAGAIELTPSQFDVIIAYMSETFYKENELLSYIKSYIFSRGYYFDDETLYNYHICLKTRPFLILAGLSGTGKSKLSQLYAEALGHTVRNKRYLRLAIRPGWNDDRFLLGYLNTLTGKYITEPAVDFLLQAGSDNDNLYFLCLDEMNLAHVEYYFSQFLSALEEDSPSDRIIPLFSERMLTNLGIGSKNVGIAPSVLIPPNLLFTGTINIDETTQQLSDKVIDRANTIEFFIIDLEKMPERVSTPQPITISSAHWQSYIVQEADSTYRSSIVQIAKILNKADLGFGYRVVRDIERYLANSHNIIPLQEAFDLQVKQRILPHVRGTEFILPILDDLLAFTERHNLNRSQKRIEEMKGRLRRDGYTSFWR